ncbi:hypothetical protein CS542_10055 [Pedobacter sp. IW39]|nr:hypothetical protein CS542_10055 [Pedobacter sp. IW39]
MWKHMERLPLVIRLKLKDETSFRNAEDQQFCAMTKAIWGTTALLVYGLIKQPLLCVKRNPPSINFGQSNILLPVRHFMSTQLKPWDTNQIRRAV